jgi:PAS domain S-box-containing protein
MLENFIRIRLRLFEFAVSHSLEELLQKTIDEVGALTQSPIGFYHFVDSDQKTLSLQVWSTRTVNEFCKVQGKGIHYGIDQAGVWVDCVHQRRPVIHNDYVSLPHRKGMPPGHATVVRELVVPIIKADRIVAILGVGNKPADYTEEDGQIVSFLADMSWEIVERKQLYETLQKSEYRYNALIDNLNCGVAIYNAIDNGEDFIFEDLNKMGQQIDHVQKNELIGKSVLEKFPGVKEFGLFDVFQRVWKTGRPEHHPIAVFQKVWKTGRPEHHSIFRYKDERIIGWRDNFVYKLPDGKIVAIYSDETKRMQAEEALRKSEQEKSTILNTMSELVAYQDTDHTVLWTNKCAANAVGKNQEDLKGRKCYEIWAHREKPCEMCPVEKAIETGKIQNHEITTANGRIWDIKGYPIRNDQGEIVGAVEITLEVTQRKRAEQALRNAELEKKTILDVQPNLVILQDLNLSVIWANRTACESAGLPLKELIGKYCYKIWAQRDDICPDCPVALSIKTGRMQEVIKTTPDGRTWQVKGCPVWNESGRIVGAVEICDDITERVALESQLHQARKLESIGNLAGGIAHEFNNILGIIIGNTELAIEDVPEWNPAKNCLEEIRTASLRAKDVVRQILSFARKTPATQKPIKISTLIKESLKLIRATIPTTIEIRQEILCETEMILGTPSEINQILINLCTNSVHAMDENSGVLEVRLEHIRLNDQSTTQYQGLPPGDFAKLTVKDSGHGIEPEIMDRILDPYFTTKDIDKGLGMGLAVVYGIVKKYDGDIKIMSEVGNGTTAEVLFPIIEAQAETQVQETDDLPKGTECILVVDDEASLVKIIKRILERQGYDVVGKTSSTEALKLFQEKSDKFYLIITDMAMPHMAGDRLAHELLKIRQGMPIILCTGHSDRIDEDEAKKLGIRAYVMKPLVKAVLAKTVRKVLDEAKGSVKE